jgi:hypothetical protein
MKKNWYILIFIILETRWKILNWVVANIT